MINRKQLVNIEKLTRVLNDISGQAERMAAILKKEINTTKDLIATLQQDKITLTNKLNTLATKINALDTRLSTLEVK